MTLKEKYDKIIDKREKLVALEESLGTKPIVGCLIPAAVISKKEEFEELADVFGVDLVETVPFDNEWGTEDRMSFFMYRGIKFMHFFKGVEE